MVFETTPMPVSSRSFFLLLKINNKKKRFQACGRVNPIDKSSMSYRLQITLMGICEVRTNGPNRRHQCNIGLEPSKGQVSE